MCMIFLFMGPFEKKTTQTPKSSVAYLDGFFSQVRWDNGKRGNYRFGLFGKYDVEVW